MSRSFIHLYGPGGSATPSRTRGQRTHSCVCVLLFFSGFGWSSTNSATPTPLPSWLTWPTATLIAMCSIDAKSVGHYANGTTWRSDTMVAGAGEEEGSLKLLATVWCQALENPTFRNAKMIKIPGRCHCCCWWKMLPEAMTSWRSPTDQPEAPTGCSEPISFVATFHSQFSAGAEFWENKICNQQT